MPPRALFPPPHLIADSLLNILNTTLLYNPIFSNSTPLNS